MLQNIDAPRFDPDHMVFEPERQSAWILNDSLDTYSIQTMHCIFRYTATNDDCKTIELVR